MWQWGVDSGVWTGGVDGGAVGTLASGLGPGGTGPAATESQAERLSPWVFVLPCGMPLHVPWLCGLLRRPLVLEAATWESRGGTEAGDPGPWLSPRAECSGICLGPWEPAEPGLAPSWASHAGAGSLSPPRASFWDATSRSPQAEAPLPSRLRPESSCPTPQGCGCTAITWFFLPGTQMGLGVSTTGQGTCTGAPGRPRFGQGPPRPGPRVGPAGG